jgi:hypothetical protein
MVGDGAHEAGNELSELVLELHSLLHYFHSEIVDAPDVDGELENRIADLARNLRFVAGQDEMPPDGSQDSLANRLQELAVAVFLLRLGIAKGTAHAPSREETKRH